MFDSMYKYKIEGEDCALLYRLISPDSTIKNPYITIKGFGFLKPERIKPVTITIPEKINGYDVKSISPAAFYKNQCAKGIIIPNSVKYIGENAFSGSSVQSVRLGNGIKQISDRLFENCKYLVDIVLPEGIEKIGIGAFHNCINLKSIKLPDSLLEMRSSVFDACLSLESIHIGANLYKIGIHNTEDFAFGCVNLTNITVSPFNKHFYIDKNILYNADNQVLIKAFGKTKINTVIISSQIRGLAFGSFSNANIDTLIIKSKDLDGIEMSQIKKIKNIRCIPNSNVEKYFMSLGIDINPIGSNELNKFINNLVESNPDINK